MPHVWSVARPRPVSGISHCLYTFLNKGVSTLSLHHPISDLVSGLSLVRAPLSRPLIGWPIPCLPSACQRDRPRSVNVLRHNLNEHLGPDTNLENYWIYIPDTFHEYKIQYCCVQGRADGDDVSYRFCTVQTWLCDASLESRF